MIGIDTNVLLRFLMTDDLKQYESAVEFFRSRSAENPAYISLFVFAEACWVMRKRYGYKNQEIASLFRGLLESRELVFEDSDFIETMFLADGFGKFDVADYMIAELAKRIGCSKTVTFDKTAARYIPGMELLA